MIHIRKVTRGSKKKFDYSINLPKEVVETMGLLGATVQLVNNDKELIITKIDNNSVSKPNQSDDKIDEFSDIH